MNRRKLLAMPVLGIVFTPLAGLAAARPSVPFSQELYEAALASGEPFMLDFKAHW